MILALLDDTVLSQLDVPEFSCPHKVVCPIVCLSQSYNTALLPQRASLLRGLYSITDVGLMVDNSKLFAGTPAI